MITLLLATLVANPVLTGIQIGSTGNRANLINDQDASVVINNNYPNQAYKYEVFKDDTSRWYGGNYRSGYNYQLNVGGNQFEFATYAQIGDNGSNIWIENYFATKELYHSNIVLTNIKIRLTSVNNQTINYGTFNLPNVYFYQNNSIHVTDNPILSNYTYYWGNYDDDKYFVEIPKTTSMVSYENMVVGISFDIELIPQELINGTDYQNGYTAGWNEGNDNGFEDGYNNGYATGYKDAQIDINESGSTASIIFSGIIDVALLPINFFLACLNFEVFGINIGAFVTGLLTIAIVIILFRTIFGGGGAKND